MSEVRPKASEVGHSSKESVAAEVQAMHVDTASEFARKRARQPVVAQAYHAKLRQQAQARRRNLSSEPCSRQPNLRNAIAGAHHAVPRARRGRVRPLEDRPARVKRRSECEQRLCVRGQVLSFSCTRHRHNRHHHSCHSHGSHLQIGHGASSLSHREPE